MKACKGFNPDMTCRGFQYAEGDTYTTDSASLCNSGFHACEAPLDVLTYYAPTDDNGNLNKFHEVELEGVSSEKDSDTKRCGKKITIGAELNLFGLAKAHVEWVKEQNLREESSTGDRSAATNTGNYSAATNTGNCSAATNTGNRSAATNTGKNSIAVAWGIDSKAKAAKGSYIALAEWKQNDDYEWVLVGAKLAKVDGKRIKPDKYYKLVEGKFVETD